MSPSPLQRRLFLSGALLIFAGLVTGLWAGATLSGLVTVALPRLALGAHLNALMGGLWTIAVAITLPCLEANAQARLARWVVIPTWGNWAVTTLASFLGVNGLILNSNLSNNAVAALLQIFVVLPSLAAAWFWVQGLRASNASL